MPSQKRGDKMRNAAMQEAMRSTMRYRHGAIITKGGKILSQGHNHVRTGFSGPLFAHEAVHLPSNRQMEVKDENTSDNSCCHPATRSGPRSQSQAYFSMHAEMHAVTSALRGAKPHIPRSSLILDQVDVACSKLREMSLEMQDGSRFSDASSMVSTGKRVVNTKTKCDRALVEGAKREQERVAFATETQWCLKPRDKAGTKEKPKARPRWSFERCAVPMLSIRR